MMARHARWLGALAATLALGMLLPLSGAADGSWAAPTNLSSSSVDTMGASIVQDTAGRVHAVWAEGDVIYHRVKTGGDWATSAVAFSGATPHLAADEAGRVHLAYTQQVGGADDVYYASWSAASGWSLPVNVSESAAESLTPRIAAGGAKLALVWSEAYTDTNLIYCATSDDGDAWSSAPIPNAEGSQPTVVLGADNAPIVAWQDVFDLGFPLDIYASHLEASSWSLPVNVSYSTLGEATMLYASSQPFLAMRATGATLAWVESGEGGSAIWVAQLGADGWGDAAQAVAAGEPYGPVLAFDAMGWGHLAWGALAGVAYRTWNPVSEVWGSIETATSAVASSVVDIMAGDMLQMAWLAQATTGNRDLYYSSKSAAPSTPTVTATPSRTPTVKPVHTPGAWLYLPMIRKP